MSDETIFLGLLAPTIIVSAGNDTKCVDRRTTSTVGDWQ